MAEHWERTGGRRLSFSNGKNESYEAVAVPHEQSGGMWSRILIARDDGSLADRIAALPKLEAELHSLHSQLQEEVERLRREAAGCKEAGEYFEGGDEVNETSRRQADRSFLQAAELEGMADRLSKLLSEEGN